MSTKKGNVAQKGKGRQGTNNNNNKSDLDAMVAFIEGKVEEFKPVIAARMAAQQKVDEQRARAQMEFMRAAEAQLVAEAKQANEEVPLPAEAKAWTSAGEGKWVRFAQFDGSDEQVRFIIALYDKELSEPYSTFTYEFFIFGWKDLCILAFGMEKATRPSASEEGTMIGAVVSRVTRKTISRSWRGYIAMLAVQPTFRGGKIGSKLVTLSADLMRKKGCEQVSLETPLTNARALKLYTDLGFAKVKFLPVYYLDGADAVRLKLYLTPEQEPMFVGDAATESADAPAVTAAA